MKKTVVLILMGLGISMGLMAQKGKPELVKPDLPVNKETGLISYYGVVELPASKGDDLYRKALMWANSYYKNPADVIRERDSVAYKIVCKARYRITNEPDKDGVSTPAGDVMYTLTIEMKDGKFRYEMTRFNWQQKSAYPIERWRDQQGSVFSWYLKQTDEKATEVVHSLKKAMLSDEKKGSTDW